MELAVYNIKGEATGRKVELNDAIFGIEPNDHAIYLDVKQIRANQRQGTHASKERSMLMGSTRKLKRQKGTSGARCGDINSPLLRGGARVFGPQPRYYGFKLNKKLKRLARLSALSYKAINNKIVVVEDFSFETPKTKQFIQVMKDLSLENKKTLIVTPETNINLLLSGRNVKGYGMMNAASLNTYDVLNADTMLILESSLASIEESFLK
ncbi:MAG: 50S ribosomal protein L4 [Bacteroidales bacterium]|nr:50S ribosomal protein L4 [Bacteroidales bacterium]